MYQSYALAANVYERTETRKTKTFFRPLLSSMTIRFFVKISHATHFAAHVSDKAALTIVSHCTSQRLVVCRSSNLQPLAQLHYLLSHPGPRCATISLAPLYSRFIVPHATRAGACLSRKCHAMWHFIPVWPTNHVHGTLVLPISASIHTLIACVRLCAL